MLKTRQLHIAKEPFGGSKDEPWGYYFWEDYEKPSHVYTAFCYKRGHATTVCAKDLDVVVKCEACAALDFDDGVIMTGLSGMVKDVQFDDDEATQFVLNFKNEHKFMPFKDEEFLKVLDKLIAKRDNKMIIEADNKHEEDDFFALLRKEPTVDWNIWHNAFMRAYDQIDFKKCAKTRMYYKALENPDACDPDDEVQVEVVMDELKDDVKNEVESAILSWSENKDNHKSNSFVSSSDKVRVTVWGPDSDEENHMPCVHITIFIHDSID